MSKMKTNKAVAKRLLIKRSKRHNSVKILKRACGQDHFNSREPGKVTRHKRVDNLMSRTVQQTVLRALPYA